MNNSLIVLYTLITALFIFFGLRGIRNTNPVFFFSGLNWIFAVGILSNLDFSVEADLTHAIIIFLTAILFYLGSILVLKKDGDIIRKTNAFHDQKLNLDINTSVFYYLLFLLFISIVVSILYYNAIGYNVFLLSVKSLLNTGSVVDDLSTLRLESYAGDRYFAPGYVNQFKNILLPFIASILFIYAVFKRKTRIKWLIALLTPLTLILLLGTGQRGAFVQAMLVTFIIFGAFFSKSSSFKKYYKKARKKIFLFTLLIFLISTVVGGRAGDENFLIGAFQGIFYRIFESNQSTAIIGFRYVYNQEIQWGYEWFENIRGILPGYKGSELSGVIFEIFYGSRRGTAPVSIWGSVWHNAWWAGIIFSPLLMGMLYAKVYIKLITGKKTFLRLSSYSAGILVLSYWGAGSAVQLLNNGLLAIIIFYYSSRLLYHLK